MPEASMNHKIFTVHNTQRCKTISQYILSIIKNVRHGNNL